MSDVILKATNFGREMTDSIRNEDYNGMAFSYNFDIPEKERLVARRTFTTITDADERIFRFLYTKFNSSGVVYRLYGLGKNISTNNPSLYQRQMTDAGWTAVSSGNGSTGLVATNVFFYYKNYLYMWQALGGASSVLSRFGDLTGSPSFTNSYQAIASTNTVAQPVHHLADDIAYFFHDNKVSKLDNTSWSLAALTLPDNLKIVGGAQYGDYLAILCSPVEPGTAESMLYLWDRNSSLTTISAKINLGMGEVYYCGNDANGVFIVQKAQALSALGEYNTKLRIKYYRGYLIEKELTSSFYYGYFSDLTPTGNAITVGNEFHFPATFSTSKDGVKYDVIFRAKIVGDEIVLSAQSNVPSIASGQFINGIFEVTGFWFVSYGTNPVSAYTAVSSQFSSAAVESMIYSIEDPSVTKLFKGITVFTEPLIVGASYILKYRKDSETSWTTIFTEDTDNSVSHSATVIESTGANIGTFKQIQFRVESTGGANITGWKFKISRLEEDNY